MGACHGNLNGKGGFRLSLRGDDPAFDLASLTRDALGRRIDRIQPDESLDRPEADRAGPARGGHAVPARLARGADAPRLDRRRGRPTTRRPRPSSSRLTVFPAERIVAAPAARRSSSSSRPSSPTARRRDVTRQAAYDVSDPTRVAVTPDGRVEARGPVRGRRSPSATWTAGAISRLAFLADRPDFAWRAARAGNVDRRARLRQAQGAQDPPLRAGRRRRLPPPGLPRRHRRAADPRRGPGLPGRPRPGEAGEAGRPPARRGPSSPTSGP